MAVSYTHLSETQTFVNLHQELKRHVSFKTEYQVLDSGYDYEYVYSYIRNGNGKPIIDYNKRREDVYKRQLIMPTPILKSKLRTWGI